MGSRHTRQSRRDFLKDTALLTGGAALGGLALPGVLAASPATPGRGPLVALARSPYALDQQRRASAKVVRGLLKQAVSIATGLPAERVFRSLFRPDDRVTIKVNCLAGRGLSTRPELAEAVAEELVAAGVSAKRILIWDRTDHELARAGYSIRRSGSGIRCYGTNGGYEDEPLEAGSVGSCFSTILTRQTTAIINLPILKDHDLSGVSLGMKNFYGAIHNPNKYHDNRCDPYIADLFAHPLIAPKVRLTVCDALLPQFDGGPAYKPDRCWNLGGVLASTDPLALERAGVIILERQRKEAGLPPLKEVGREPTWIESAARLGLGAAEPPVIKELVL